MMMASPLYRRDVVDWIVRRLVPVTGVPADLAVTILNGEAPGLDLNADGGTAHGLWQVELSVHGGTRYDWIGLAGAERALTDETIGGRWRRVWASTAQDWWTDDPLGFLRWFWYAAQGADPRAIAARAPDVLAEGQAIWADYQGATTMRDIPAPGPITQGFGDNPNNGTYGPEGHTGIDIGCPEGTAVRAARPGRVVYADWLYHSSFPGDPTKGYGKCVIVSTGRADHYYAHLSSLTASKGMTVARGDVLALSGSTGRVTGPHLHIEKRVNGRAVDPSDLLNEPHGEPQPEPPPLAPPVMARVASTDGLKMRGGPGTEYAQAGLLDYGTEVAVVVRDQWCELFDHPGLYVAGWWLDFGPAAVPGQDAKASAIRAWTKLRDKAAFAIESIVVRGDMVRAAEQKDIDEAAAELRTLGVN